MRSGKKALLMAACAVLLVVASVMGTLAYLTDTESVKNTFTVGNVYINLTEAEIEDGELTGDRIMAQKDTVVGNEYHLLPGLSYTKDPTVGIKEGSEPAYVHMVVTVNFADVLPPEMKNYDLTNVFKGYDANWERVSYTLGTNSIEYIYNYSGIVDYATLSTAETVFEVNGKQETYKNLPALFTEITVPSDFDNAEMDVFAGMTIAVEAHAIQAAGFNNADEAWAEFNP